jgi:NADH-quinone oxidoreductase subunit A
MLAQVSDAASAAPGVDYSDFLRQYLTVFIFGGLALLMIGLMLGAGSLLRPSSNRTGEFQEQKKLGYESGVDPVGQGWTQTQIRYYVFALLFVLFDVEAVFIFPWAIGADSLAWFGLIEMTIFVAVLLLGLAYVWRKGLLKWA